jgi:heme exporter protein A
VLETHALACVRGERRLFADLNLKAAPGVCVHVAGENGAGKTSLLRILCGLLLPASGEVLWRGEDIRKLQEGYWEELAYVGHLNGVKDDLSAAENVFFAAAIAGWRVDAAAVREALHAFGLAGFEDRPTRTLSQGQRRRVALARLHCAGAARLWILDEPYTALDARGVAALSQLIGNFLVRKGTVVLTTHQEVAVPGRVERLELAGQRHG